jgi:hypothetical protein
MDRWIHSGSILKTLQGLGMQLRAFRRGNPRKRKVACTSGTGVNNSPGFDTRSVVYSYSQTLLAADIAFCGLHRYIPKERFNLLKLASRIVAEPRTGPSEILWRETWNVHARGSLLHNVPDRLF